MEWKGEEKEKKDDEMDGMEEIPCVLDSDNQSDMEIDEGDKVVCQLHINVKQEIMDDCIEMEDGGKQEERPDRLKKGEEKTDEVKNGEVKKNGMFLKKEEKIQPKKKIVSRKMEEAKKEEVKKKEVEKEEMKEKEKEKTMQKKKIVSRKMEEKKTEEVKKKGMNQKEEDKTLQKKRVMKRKIEGEETLQKKKCVSGTIEEEKKAEEMIYEEQRLDEYTKIVSVLGTFVPAVSTVEAVKASWTISGEKGYLQMKKLREDIEEERDSYNLKLAAAAPSTTPSQSISLVEQKENVKEIEKKDDERNEKKDDGKDGNERKEDQLEKEIVVIEPEKEKIDGIDSNKEKVDVIGSEKEKIVLIDLENEMEENPVVLDTIAIYDELDPLPARPAHLHRPPTQLIHNRFGPHHPPPFNPSFSHPPPPFNPPFPPPPQPSIWNASPALHLHFPPSGPYPAFPNAGPPPLHLYLYPPPPPIQYRNYVMPEHNDNESPPPMKTTYSCGILGQNNKK